MIDSGLTKKDIELLFNQSYANLLDLFAPLRKLYVNMEDLLNESSLNAFIIKRHEFKQDIMKTVTHIIAYPLLLVGVLIGLMMIYEVLIIPNLREMLSLFTGDLQLIDIISGVIAGLMIMLLIMLICFGGVFMRYRHDPATIYHYWAAGHPDNIFIRYQTLTFVDYYLTLMAHGTATRDIFAALGGLKNDHIIKWMANKVLAALDSGKELSDIIDHLDLSPSFKRFFKTGAATGNTPQLLQRYRDMVKISFVHDIKTLAYRIQTGIYIGIGLMVLILYRVLLLPMSYMSF